MQTYTTSIPLIYQLIADLRQRSNAHITLGGAHASALPELTLWEGCPDLVVTGEGERLTNFFDRGIVGVPLMPEHEMNAMPPPARDLINPADYTRIVGGEKSANLITSRGCPYRCAFCCKAVMGHKVRFYSLDRLRWELAEIKAMGYKSLLIYDDIFAYPTPRTYAALEILKDAGLPFRCNGRANLMTERLATALANAGCATVAFGVESGNDKLLDWCHKIETTEQNEQAIKMVQAAGMIAKAYLIIGLPGETFDTVKETAEWVQRVKPDEWSLFTFAPLPGSEHYENPAKFGIEPSGDWYEYYNIAGNHSGGRAVATQTYTPDELGEWRDWLVAELSKVAWRGDKQGYMVKA